MSVEAERGVCSWLAVWALKLGHGLWSSSADLVATWHDLINWLFTTCKFYRLAHMPVRGFFHKANATCLSDKCAVVRQIKIWERLPLRCLPTGPVWWEHSRSWTGIFREIGCETRRWSSCLGWMKSKAPCLFVGVIILAHFIWCVCLHAWVCMCARCVQKPMSVGRGSGPAGPARLESQNCKLPPDQGFYKGSKRSQALSHLSGFQFSQLNEIKCTKAYTVTTYYLSFSNKSFWTRHGKVYL